MREEYEQVVEDTTMALQHLQDEEVAGKEKGALKIGPIPPAGSKVHREWEVTCLVRRATVYSKQQRPEAGTSPPFGIA